MNLIEMLLNANNGLPVKQLAQNFGIGESDARNAVSQLAPALTQGLQKNAASEQGLAAMLKALGKGNHQRYLDHPEELGRKKTVADGNGILGHLLGSKRASRDVASAAAARSGLDSGLMKKMLPVVAGMLMGSVSKEASAKGMLAGLGSGQGQGDALGMLKGFLDADGDGSVTDDLLGMAKKLF